MIDSCENLLESTTISKFEKEPKNVNGWSNRILNIMRSTLNKCKNRYEKHSSEAQKCSTFHKIISLPGTICSGIATSLAMWVVSSPSSATIPITVSIAIFSAISTTLDAIENTLRYNEKEYEHKKAVDKYGELSRKIELNIIQPDSNAKNVLSEIIKDYEVIIANSPHIGFFEEKKNIYSV